MPEKLVTRVLSALEHGCETSLEVSGELGISVVAAAQTLRNLYCFQAVEREPLPPKGRGRPGFRYRIRGFVS